MSIVISDDETEKYVQRAIPEASVLKVDGVFSAKWKTEAKTGIFKNSNMIYTTPNLQYLKCIDPKRKTVYIPYTTQGKFYTLYDTDISDQYALYRIKDLSRMFNFPLKVRLIYGTSPIGDEKFTDLLYLNSKEEIESIITSSIGLKKNVLLEIPVETSVFVNLPVAEGSALEMDTVKEAITFTNKYAWCFKRRMKESLFKIDEVTEARDKEGADNEMKNQKKIKAKPNSMNTAQEIPFNQLKDMKVESAKTDPKESNDWDECSLKEYQSENMEILRKREQPKENLLVKFEEVDLEKSTVV